MNPSRVFRGVGAICVAAAFSPLLWPAESSAARANAATSAARPPASASKSGSARGILPDPVLLDGSAHPAEKKSEFGMVGDFELPGDENVREGRVGGPQNPNQGQSQQNQGQQGGGQGQQGGMPMGLPQGGGGGQQAQSGGQPPPQGGGGQGAPGQENANAAGQQIAGGGDPNAKPEGTQVSQLGGQGAGGDQVSGTGARPAPVAIGDSAMQIQTQTGSAGVVGSQQTQAAPNTQHHEKGTGSGGKGAAGTGGANRVERGRPIPAGL